MKHICLVFNFVPLHKKKLSIGVKQRDTTKQQKTTTKIKTSIDLDRGRQTSCIFGHTKFGN